MLTPYADCLEPDRPDDESVTIDADDAFAEIVMAYWAIRSPYDSVQDRKRAAFRAEQSEEAQEAIDTDRAARRAALLGTIWANRRPKAVEPMRKAG